MSTYEEDSSQAMEMMKEIDNLLQFFEMDSNQKIGDVITIRRPARFQPGVPQ